MTESPFDAVDPIIGQFQIVNAISASGHGAHGSVRFEPYGLFAHSHAILDNAHHIHGLAALFRGRLLIATGPRDKVEIGAYYLSGDRLEGIWVPPGAKGCDLAICGRELSHRAGGTTFEIEKAHAVDQMPYTGRLSLTYLDVETAPVRRVKFDWSLHDGDYSSFGLATGEILVSTFNFEPNTPFTIGLYEPHGGEWRGAIAHSDLAGIARETLKR